MKRSDRPISSPAHAGLDARDDVLSRLGALADPTRLRLLRVLELHELTVGEVSKVIQVPQSTVSRHLKVLSDAGWVQRRSEGTASYFRFVQDELTGGARDLWQSVRESASPAPEASQDARRLRSVLSERRTDSLEFFGRVSSAWDGVRSELFGDRFTPDALLELIPRGWTVADLGCGTGNASEVLASRVQRVIAVDFSQPMLDAARERLRAHDNVQLVQGEVGSTGLPDACVDAAVMLLVLHHLDDPAQALREAARVLRTTNAGGEVLVVDMLEHAREEYVRTMGHKHLGFSEREITRMLEDGGFGHVRVRELSAPADAKGPALFVASARVKR